jgi:hypothetical protein
MRAPKVVFALSFLLTGMAGQNSGSLTPRGYYDELVRAKALEKPATFVCFYDVTPYGDQFWTLSHFGWNPSPSDNEKLKASQDENDRRQYKLLTKELQAAWDRGSIHVVDYFRGVPTATDYFKGGDSWTRETPTDDHNKPPLVRKFTISINWKTLRYLRQTQSCRGDSCSTGGEIPSGRCELISLDAQPPEKK